MSTVAEIKTAINKLSLEDRAELLADLCGWTDDAWDRQMKSDAIAGKFGELNEAAQSVYSAGETSPLDNIRREPRRFPAMARLNSGSSIALCRMK